MNPPLESSECGVYDVYGAAKPGHVSVPHPRKDLGPGLVRAILRQAGLEHPFR